MPLHDPSTAAPDFRRGDRGDAVREIRHRLARLDPGPPAQSSAGVGAPDPDVFDDATERAVRDFQQQRGLTADGVVGRSTWRALEESRWRLGDRVLVHLPGTLQSGDDVIALQRRLNDLGFKTGRVDGRFGGTTEQAVKEFQRNIGIPPDGTCGPATLKALERLTPRVRGGSPNALRSEERIREAGPQLTGKIVVIDASASAAETAAHRRLADDATLDLTRRVEGRLGATGVQAFLSAPRPAPESQEGQRAEFANRADAHLCVSVRVDVSDERVDQGVSTYYYGIDAHEVRSWVGERFAGLVQREIVARTGLTDLRSHPRSWDLLRQTRMPTVCVEIGCLPEETESRLADPAFRDRVAEGIVVAVQRLYLSPEHDAHTGVLRVDDLRALRDSPG